jgi:hypothetical protein
MFSPAQAPRGNEKPRCGLAGLLVLSALLGGCGAGPAHNGRVWAKSYAFGTLGQRDFDARDVCGERGAERIELVATPSTVLLSLVTLGIYTPKEVRVRCR